MVNIGIEICTCSTSYKVPVRWPFLLVFDLLQKS